MTAVLPNEVRKLLKMAACKTSADPSCVGKTGTFDISTENRADPSCLGRTAILYSRNENPASCFYKMLNIDKMIIKCCPSERSEETVQNGYM